MTAEHRTGLDMLRDLIADLGADDFRVDEPVVEGTTRASDLIGPHGVRVRASRCSTCVFFPGNRMQLAPGGLADLIGRNTGKWLTCHQTLQIVAGRGHAAVCHGWEQAYGLDPSLDELVGLFGREDV